MLGMVGLAGLFSQPQCFRNPIGKVGLQNRFEHVVRLALGLLANSRAAASCESQLAWLPAFRLLAEAALLHLPELV